MFGHFIALYMKGLTYISTTAKLNATGLEWGAKFSFKIYYRSENKTNTQTISPNILKTKLSNNI